MALTVPRFLLCALLGLALVPSAARADIEAPVLPVPAADAQMTAAHALAVTRWGVDPCHGQVSVTWAHMGDGINARSQWMSTNGADPSTYSDCAISYNLDVDWDWPKLCTVVEHELGHLAGHDHVNDPHDVMSPYYVYPSTECAAGSVAAAPAPTPQAAPVAQTSPASSHKAAKHKKVKRTAAARKAAARRAAKARAAKARAARARAAKARAAKARAAKGRGRARVAVSASADSSAHAQLFGCVLVSA